MTLLHERALERPDHMAVRMGSGGACLTYAELDAAADRVAHWLIGLGLQPGEAVALLLENHLRSFELWWGARRAGLYYVPVSVHLAPREAAHILRDSGATVLVTSRAQGSLASAAVAELDAPQVPHRLMLDGVLPGFGSYEDAVAGVNADAPLPVRPEGREFMYSSGTTGLPKGIRRAMTPPERRGQLPALETTLRDTFRFDASVVYLQPSPLYHATGRFTIRTLERGGTVVLMEKFDAREALRLIEEHRVTHAHWVPTMFVRLLDLPEAERRGRDCSSLRCAIHAAAPCAPDVKQAMIDWWGPVVEEYYGGSENVGVTHVDTAGWLAHRGTVGRAIYGEAHILDEESGRELPPGETGAIWFAGSAGFEYHNDPEKTRRAVNARGWGTYGDFGHLDADGYLYISDRRTDLIISGGVNVYPKEIEDVLVQHPAVRDVAVIGVPDREFGQRVVAVVELRDPGGASPALADELVAWARARLSHVKAPRRVVFDALPRSETGKLLKRVLRDRHAVPAPTAPAPATPPAAAAAANEH